MPPTRDELLGARRPRCRRGGATREILRAVELEDKADLLATYLGHGLQRHLEIAIALACAPKLLLLDEPTAGMSPEETERTIALIKRIAAGRTVILVEHKMKVVMAISDRITVLHQGAVLAEGTPGGDPRATTASRRSTSAAARGAHARGAG